jgi:hypothetical protein
MMIWTICMTRREYRASHSYLRRASNGVDVSRARLGRQQGLINGVASGGMVSARGEEAPSGGRLGRSGAWGNNIC